MMTVKAPTPRMQAAADEFAAASREAGFVDANVHAHDGKPTHMYLTEHDEVELWCNTRGWRHGMMLEANDD